MGKYQAKLYTLHSQRFGNVKGPLYDPETGWNPAYRIREDDLVTYLPTGIFEPLSNTPFRLGVPSNEKFKNTIGYVPFSWYPIKADGKQGEKNYVDPILFEIQRAQWRKEVLWSILNYFSTWGINELNGDWGGTYWRNSYSVAGSNVLIDPQKEARAKK